MSRRNWRWACVGLAVGVLAVWPAADARAQVGAYRGGPVGGGPTGPSLFTGAYAPSFYNGPLPSSYSGFGPSYGAGASFLPGPASSSQSAGGITVPISGMTGRAAYGPGTSLPRTAGDYTARSSETPRSDTAYFKVQLPENAQLSVEDFRSTQTGAERYYHTPSTLLPGTTYEYTFRAQWKENDQTVTRDRTIRFKGGDALAIDFTKQ